MGNLRSCRATQNFVALAAITFVSRLNIRQQIDWMSADVHIAGAQRIHLIVPC